MSRLSQPERNRQELLLRTAPTEQMGVLAFASEQAIGSVATSLMTQLRDTEALHNTRRRLEYGSGKPHRFFWLRAMVDMSSELTPLDGNAQQIAVPGFSDWRVVGGQHNERRAQQWRRSRKAGPFNDLPARQLEGRLSIELASIEQPGSKLHIGVATSGKVLYPEDFPDFPPGPNNYTYPDEYQSFTDLPHALSWKARFINDYADALGVAGVTSFATSAGYAVEADSAGMDYLRELNDQWVNLRAPGNSSHQPVHSPVRTWLALAV